MNRDQILTAVRTCLERSDEKLVAAWVFGSVARDEMREDSDVDVALLFESAPPPSLDAAPARLQVALTSLVGREVDVIDLHRAPCDLAHRVLRDGVRVLERDRSARIAFEVRSRNEYFDLLPHLRRYRKRETMIDD